MQATFEGVIRFYDYPHYQLNHDARLLEEMICGRWLEDRNATRMEFRVQAMVQAYNSKKDRWESLELGHPYPVVCWGGDDEVILDLHDSPNGEDATGFARCQPMGDWTLVTITGTLRRAAERMTP